MSDIPGQEGKLDFHVDSVDTPCQTYYKVIGIISPTGPPPLVLLHGGPGAGHEYLLPLSKVWTLYGIPSIHYDQIGCAASTHFPEKMDDRSFWSVDLFVAELENLLDHFQLRRSDGSGYHVLGHSWGGKIAVDFASRRPPGLQRLILFSASASGRHFTASMDQLRKQISPQSQQAVNEALRTRDFKSSGYLAAMHEFSSTFMCRANPSPPAELVMSFKHISSDPTVRETFQGRASPWIYDGILGNHTSIPQSTQITVPTLLLNGEFDTAKDDAVWPFFENIPRVRWFTIPGASHMPFLDSPEMLDKTLRLLGDFLIPKSCEHENKN